MATKTNIAVPVMRPKDYRDPKTFIWNMGGKWEDFLDRWNDPNITTDEAKGLLHVVADRLGWTDFGRENLEEDSREACVRFLLYYANYPVKVDSEWQIVEMARQILIHKALGSSYLEKEAPQELLEDVIMYLAAFMKNESTYRNEPEPYRSKIEDFIRMLANSQRYLDIDGKLTSALMAAFFQRKPAH